MKMLGNEKTRYKLREVADSLSGDAQVSSELIDRIDKKGYWTEEEWKDVVKILTPDRINRKLRFYK